MKDQPLKNLLKELGEEKTLFNLIEYLIEKDVLKEHIVIKYPDGELKIVRKEV